MSEIDGWWGRFLWVFWQLFAHERVGAGIDLAAGNADSVWQAFREAVGFRFVPTETRHGFLIIIPKGTSKESFISITEHRGEDLDRVADEGPWHRRFGRTRIVG